MHVHSTRYIDKCKSLGILTEEPIRKYPLRSANLAMVLKAYSVEAYLPYDIDARNYDILDDKLYLTDAGLKWLYSVFEKHSLAYLKRVFQFVFSKATPASLNQLDAYEGMSNFKGITGDKPKAGSKQKAILIRAHGKNGAIKDVYNFNTLHEARQEVLMLTRFYPLEEFTLYRIRKQTKKGKVYHYKEEVPLVLPPSKRGLSVNLPHLKE